MKRTSENKINSFEEYKKKYFPSSTKQVVVQEQDPYKYGMSLAKESLNRVKHILLPQK